MFFSYEVCLAYTFFLEFANSTPFFLWFGKKHVMNGVVHFLLPPTSRHTTPGCLFPTGALINLQV